MGRDARERVRGKSFWDSFFFSGGFVGHRGSLLLSSHFLLLLLLFFISPLPYFLFSFPNLEPTRVDQRPAPLRP